MICYDCTDLSSIHCNISDHKEYHVWKCRYCCDIAVWFCWGNTHFCEPCHQKAWTLKDTPQNQLPVCKGKEYCKLKIDHPPNGEEFSLGCGVCIEEHEKKKNNAKVEEENEKKDDKGKGEKTDQSKESTDKKCVIC